MTRRRVTPGEYFVRTLGGPLEPTAPGIPDIVICRRVVDFPHGELPPGAAVVSCDRCCALIATNQAKYPERPHHCMQCAGIEPLPFDSRAT